jgi:hypothetical protein
LGRAAIDRRPDRGLQIVCAETIPPLQPHQQRDGLLPPLSIVVAERLSA